MMMRKTARVALAATFAAGLAMAVSSLPASAAARPGVGQGEEVVLTYYSDATHSTVVGGYEFGCVFASWGEMTSYYTTTEHAC